jgi:hypothetical protein
MNMHCSDLCAGSVRPWFVEIHCAFPAFLGLMLLQLERSQSDKFSRNYMREPVLNQAVAEAFVDAPASSCL